jgi:hypothetical protein
MTETLGQVALNRLEDLKISLMKIPVECRLLDPTTFWPGKWIPLRNRP